MRRFKKPFMMNPEKFQHETGPRKENLKINLFTVRILAVMFFLTACPPVFAAVKDAGPPKNEPSLAGLSLEELMNVEIYSASKKVEKQFDSPAAAYVLTNEDIRRSGVTTVMDALRLVPGVSVQRVRGQTWDISIRGFNGGVFANKLLVMIDGRSVYTPLQGGVTWALQDLVLEDVERIEIIRGPGGTLWGANAVNGVINILTKKAKDTQGVMTSGGGGSEESGFGTFRYGGKMDETFYRGYIKHFHKAEGYRGDDFVNDDWRMTRGGFKAEHGGATVQGDLYGGRIGSLSNRFTTPPVRGRVESYDTLAYGGDILAKYEVNDFHLQAYWDRTVAEGRTLNERRDRVDLDFNHQFSLPLRQQIIWGGGYRWDIDRYTNSLETQFYPESETHHTVSAFAQDEITLIENYWKLIGGTKLEYTTFVGFEVQPNVRTIFTPHEKHVLWASLSRAVRTPSRFELDSFQSTVSGTALVQIEGNPDLQSENVISWEGGYRTQIIPKTSVDAAVYYNEYDNFLSLRVPISGAYFNGTNVVLPGQLRNDATADTYGFELGADVAPTEWWKIRNGYTFTKVVMHINIGADDSGGIERFNETTTPKNIFYTRNSFDLPGGFQFDAILRYADQIDASKVRPYTELDLRLAYQWKNLLLEVVGRDLIEGHHKEQGSAGATEVERSVFGRAAVTI